MINPLLSLTFSMHASPGTYAVLLGSGVSRSASIPTGWEVVLDLINQLARLMNENCESDPVAWFKAKYEQEPTYSGLLEMVAKFPAERSSLLQKYFEPTDGERESGLKVPTKAHHALARLVKSSHVKVILTTNFDRLMEQALNAVGITPTIIDNPDAVDGAMPMIHNPCTLVKLHGDYRDLRTKNTPVELEEYDPCINGLLDRVLDEFGLIICGWSGESDPALRKAFKRCKNRRFTTYWAAHNGHLKPDADELAKLRAAEKISIKGADHFFSELAEKIDALVQIDQPHPMSTKMAVAQVKKYIESKSHIRLRDLLKEDVEQIVNKTDIAHYPVATAFPEEINAVSRDKELTSRIKAFETISATSVAIIATGCFWGEKEHVPFWVEAVDRLANPSNLPQTGLPCVNMAMHSLRVYPAILMLYAGGIAATASGRYETLLALLSQPKIRCKKYSDSLSAWLISALRGAMQQDIFMAIPGLENMHIARSVRLLHVLREPLREFLPGDDNYWRTFNRFEAIRSLWLADTDGVVLDGVFTHRRYGSSEESVLTEMLDEQQAMGNDWPLFKAGFFGGQPERWDKALKQVMELQK